MARRNDAAKWPPGRYRLSQKAYMARVPGGDHEVLDEGTEVVWDGLPGPHMDALDAQAKANVEHAQKTHGTQTLDPTNELSLILGEIDDVDAEIEKAQAHTAALIAKRRQAQLSGQSSTITAPAPLADAQDARTEAPAGPLMTALPGLPPPLSAPPPPA